MTNQDRALVINSALLFSIGLRWEEGFWRWLEAGLDELGLTAVVALFLERQLSELTDGE